MPSNSVVSVIHRNDFRPIPDPTVLTTQQLNREIAKERDIYEARFSEINRVILSAEKEIQNVEKRSHSDVETLKTLVYDHLRCNDERFAYHLQANDKAYDEFKRYIDVAFHGIDSRLISFRSYHDEAIRQIDSKFDIIEKDITRRIGDTKATIEAAFVASKDAAFEQNKSNALAVSKSESSFTDQIKQLNISIQTITSAVNDKIDDVKDRMNHIEQMYKSGEGHTKGIGDMWGWVVGFIGVAATVITLMMMLVEKKPL